jgi:hypothetical protein
MNVKYITSFIIMLTGCASTERVDKLENTVRAIAYVQNEHAMYDSDEHVKMIKQIQFNEDRMDGIQELVEELELKISRVNRILDKSFDKNMKK